MYKEKLFRIILPTIYFKVIEIGEESLMYIITERFLGYYFNATFLKYLEICVVSNRF